jgi:hypothetical protein
MDNQYFIEIDSRGTKRYKNAKKQLHRLDGPAVEWADGNKKWYCNGKLHRLDGPAVIYSNGYKSWYIKDMRHREDGPAVIYPDNYKSWWLKDRRYETKEEWFNAISDKNKIKCFFSEDFLNG